MIHVKLGEEFREPLEKIKKYFPGTSNSQIVTNIINSYLPIYEEGIESLHNPQLTIGKTDSGMGLTTSTKPPVNAYFANGAETKPESEPKSSPEPTQQNSPENSEEIPEELENLFD